MKEKISDLVLFNDHQILVMRKPAGIPTHDDKTEDTSLLKMAQAYCHKDVHVMTRLDRPVSGLVLMTKSTVAHKSIEKQWGKDSFNKRYLAIVEKGDFPDENKIESLLIRDTKRNKAHLSKNTKKGKLAITEYKIIKKMDNYYVLEIVTKTGRFHQIRCQLASEGIFIKGDVKYGARRGNKDRSIDLHAWKLDFEHPTKNESMEFVAEIPETNVIWQELKNDIQ